MAINKISQFTEAEPLDGSELMEVSQPSLTVTITATTISALASDNSFNDSANGFLTAGFAEGDQIRVTGFTGNVANNIFSAKVTVATAGKLTIGGTDGDVIVDDAAGESVTITKWTTKRTTVADVGVGAAIDATDVTYFPANLSDWPESSDPGNVNNALDEISARVVVLEEASGGTVDASAVTFTPLDTDDWAGSDDPGNVDDALDELAMRVKDIEIAPASFSVGFGFTTTPTASEVLLLYTFAEAVTFPDEWSGSVGDIGTNPTSSFVLDVQKNGASVGTVTISTGGAFTLVTTGGTVAFAIGDQLKIVGPGSADATAANVSITFLGAK